MTDGELLDLYARECSDTAFRELVDRHLDLVYSAALRQTKSRSDLAEDVCQLVFAELARKAPLLTRHPSIRGWLFLCTRHLSARTMRSERRRMARESSAQAMNELATPTAAEWEKVRPVLDEVLCHLREEDREAIFLRFFDKLSFADLGARFGVGEDAARRRVERVLERTRRLLAQRGITSSAAALGVTLAAQSASAAPKELAAGVAQSALSAASTAPTGLPFTLALMKSIALSTTFIAIIAATGFLAGGVGIYFSHELARNKAAAPANAAAVAAAEGRLSRIKRQLATVHGAGSPQATSLSAKAAVAPTSLEDQVARDLELSHWRNQQSLARAVLFFAPFFKQRGVTAEQVQQLEAAARKCYSDLDDLREVASLAGVQIQSDPDLLSRAQQIEAQYSAAVTGIIGADTMNASEAYASGLESPNQNSLQSGEARWVADQVAGTAFAEGTPITAEQKTQMAQLLLKYTPNYQPGEPGGPATLDWSGIISEAQQTSAPASEISALQSFSAEAATWELKKQAQAAAGRPR